MANEALKAKIKDAEERAKIISDEALELEQWAAIAAKIAENPEESPFKLMIKTLNKGFGNVTYEDRVISSDRIIKQWFDARADPRLQSLETFLVGKKQPLTVAQAFPQYFNQFQFQGDQSKEIETWYSSESWKGVSTTYYQEAAWRRSVLAEVQATLIQLNLALVTASTAPPTPAEAPPTVPQPEPPSEQAEQEKLYDKYYQDFLARGLTEEEARNLATDYAGVLAAKSTQAEQATPVAPIRPPATTTPQPSLGGAFGGLPAQHGFDRFDAKSVPGGGARQAQHPETTRILANAEKYRNTAVDPLKGGIMSVWDQIRNAQIIQSTEEREQAAQAEQLSEPNQPSQVQNAAAGAIAGSAGVAGSLAKGGIKALASKAVDLAAKAAGPVVAAAHKALQWISKVIPNEWKRNARDFVAGALVQLYITIGRIFSAISGGLSTLLSNLTGSAALAPATAAFPAGVAVGGGSSFLGGATGGTLAGGGGTSGFGILAGGGAPVVLAVGTTAAVSLLTIVGTAAAFVGGPEEAHLDQDVEVAFNVSKEASPQTTYPDYTVGPETITYSINITATEDITIKSIKDKQTLYGKENRTQPIGDETDLLTAQLELKKGQTYTVAPSPTLTAVGAEFKDTAVTNVVTVVADTQNGEQTLTALETVTFGDPPADQPYGYPVTGFIRTVGALNGSKLHCGTFYRPDGTAITPCLPGGMDIGAPGNRAVQSTVNGSVVASGFYKGNGKRTYLVNGKPVPCPKVTATSEYTCYGFGGYVQIQDRSGRFNVVYLHLNPPSLKPGDEVIRGQEIGTIYPGYDLPNSSAPHVHYQVMQGGANVPFTNSSGPCTQGKLLPLPGPAIGESRAAGPFVCE